MRMRMPMHTMDKPKYWRTSGSWICLSVCSSVRLFTSDRVTLFGQYLVMADVPLTQLAEIARSVPSATLCSTVLFIKITSQLKRYILLGQPVAQHSEDELPTILPPSITVLLCDSCDIS